MPAPPAAKTAPQKITHWLSGSMPWDATDPEDG
jgi:hypothetical protein